MMQTAGLQGAILRGTTQRRAPIPGLTWLWSPLWTGLLAVCLSVAPVYSQLTQEDQETLLKLHDQYRVQVEPTAANMVTMHWDENLRILAESYAVKCIWKHNPDLEELKYGENLYVTEGPLLVSQALMEWFMEHQDYDYYNNTCQEDKMCGHYTQMVWAHSSAVGCASHLCDTIEGLDFKKASFLVCNYFPAGNYYGKQPYEEGEWCSNCPENYPRCQDHLCMPEAEPTGEPSTEVEEEDTVSPAPGTAGPSTHPGPPELSFTTPAQGGGEISFPWGVVVVEEGEEAWTEPTEEEEHEEDEEEEKEKEEEDEEMVKEKEQERKGMTRLNAAAAGVFTKPAFIVIHLLVFFLLVV